MFGVMWFMHVIWNHLWVTWQVCCWIHKLLVLTHLFAELCTMPSRTTRLNWSSAVPMTMDTVVMFSCPAGYEQVGVSTAVCGQLMSGTVTMPQCISKSPHIFLKFSWSEKIDHCIIVCEEALLSLLSLLTIHSLSAWLSRSSVFDLFLIHVYQILHPTSRILPTNF